MASEKDKIQGNARKIWSNDEAKGITVKYFFKVSEKLKLVVQCTIQSHLKKAIHVYSHATLNKPDPV